MTADGGALATLAHELQVADRVHLLGHVADDRLNGLYGAADLFLMTSRGLDNGDVEGFGIAVLEAAMCGTPAVVSMGSGLVEAVDDGRTGIAVPQDDPNATADAIIQLLREPGLLDEFGRRARQRASEGFTWTIIAHRYLDVLERVAR